MESKMGTFNDSGNFWCCFAELNGAWSFLLCRQILQNQSQSCFFLHILHENFYMNFYLSGWHDGNNAASVPAPFHQGLRSVPGRLAQLQEARLHQAHPPVQRQLAFVPFWSSAFSNNSLCSFLSQIPIKITSNSAHESVIAVCPSRYVCAVITDLYLFSNEHVSLIASYLSQYGDCTFSHWPLLEWGQQWSALPTNWSKLNAVTIWQKCPVARLLLNSKLWPNFSQHCANICQYLISVKIAPLFGTLQLDAQSLHQRESRSVTGRPKSSSCNCDTIYNVRYIY